VSSRAAARLVSFDFFLEPHAPFAHVALAFAHALVENGERALRIFLVMLEELRELESRAVAFVGIVREREIIAEREIALSAPFRNVGAQAEIFRRAALGRGDGEGRAMALRTPS